MRFWIDGDNCPGKRTVAIEKLTEKDIVKIFYASNNSFYAKQANRDALIKKASCMLEFVVVPAGGNSVDFAITVDISKTCTLETFDVACIVSADKHFDIVAREVSKCNQEKLVKRVESIEEGVYKFYLMEANSESEIKDAFIKMYGRIGQKEFSRIKEIIVKSYLQQKKVHLAKSINLACGVAEIMRKTYRVFNHSAEGKRKSS